MTKLRDGLLLLVGVALALRVAAWLVGPALELIVVLFVLVAIYTFLFNRQR